MGSTKAQREVQSCLPYRYNLDALRLPYRDALVEVSYLVSLIPQRSTVAIAEVLGSNDDLVTVETPVVHSLTSYVLDVRSHTGHFSGRA